LKKMAIDTVTYLPDDILTKVDRAAMAVSLETRVPMLDHAVVELAWKLKFAYKVDGNSGKAILKDLLYEYVPRNLIDRPKMGFGVPVGSWIKGPLRDWAEELLCEKSLTSGGSFDAKKVRQVWSDHLTGKTDSSYAIWNVLMWQAWFKKESG
jgi:asparagine synthase (glutamine-hydrolysing)